MKNRVFAVLAVALGLVAGAAQAALPTEATAAFTVLQGNVTDVLASGWPIIALSVGGFALWKLFRRAGSQVV